MACSDNYRHVFSFHYAAITTVLLTQALLIFRSYHLNHSSSSNHHQYSFYTDRRPIQLGLIQRQYIQEWLTLSLPQATIVDNVHSARVSTEVDIYCMLVKFTTYCILIGCGKLRTVLYFQKINRWRKLIYLRANQARCRATMLMCPIPLPLSRNC